MQLHLRRLGHARGPVILQVVNTLLFALAADALVEIDRLADALLDGKAARAQRLELPDVGAARLTVAGERPYLLNLVLLYPQHSGADRRGEKLVQSGSKVIAMQVWDFEVDQAEGVCTVADDFDTAGVRHVGNLLDRHCLANPVDHVGYVNELRAVGDGLLVGPYDRGVVLN